jgi:predicted phage baseplate assembly protein
VIQQRVAAPALDCPAPALAQGMVGLKRVDVSDTDTVLTVTFEPPFPPPAHPELLLEVQDPRNWALTGGARLHPQIVEVEPGGTDGVVLTLDQGGDFSVYSLTLLGDRVDPILATRQLRFRLRCELPFDCRPGTPTPAPAEEQPVAIDYLAKDYTSFRQALLDFIPTRLPEWNERNEADVSMALLELLAATGDNLSYLQDRVANEAFLSSARQRRSVQGHLSLLGYQLDSGSAAHTWLQFQVTARQSLSAKFAVSTVSTGGEAPVIFETLTDRLLVPEQNQMQIYNWESPGCCLESGSNSATLVGSLSSLSAGDYISFEDTQSGARDVVRLTSPPADSPALGPGTPPLALTLVTWSALTPLNSDYCIDTTVVRGNLVLATHGATLEKPESVQLGQAAQAASVQALVVPRSGAPGTIFQLSAWGFNPGDQVACAATDPTGKAIPVSPSSVLADESGTVEGISITTSPTDIAGTWAATFTRSIPPSIVNAYWTVTPTTATGAAARGLGQRPPRLRATLEQTPLTFVDAATMALEQPVGSAPADPFSYARRSVPQLTLTVDGKPWQQVLSLLESGPADEVYQVDTDDDGRPTLLFGRGGELGADPASGLGRRPPDTSRVEATYRIGNGIQGNVAADALTVPITEAGIWLLSVTNPVAAVGGRDPESLQHAISVAPPTLEKRLVAVTAADFEAAAAEFTDPSGQKLIARSKADFRWTGSWLTVNLVVQPKGTDVLSPEVRAALLGYIDARRLAGYDVQVKLATYLAIRLDLDVCARPGFNQSDVQRGLETTLSNRILAGGVKGFFHPDNFSFGDPLAISRLYQTVMAVAGVQSADINRLSPLHSAQPQTDTQRAKQSGFLLVRPDQVLQLDNDPNFPEHGQLRIRFLGGGR